MAENLTDIMDNLLSIRGAEEEPEIDTNSEELGFYNNCSPTELDRRPTPQVDYEEDTNEDEDNEDEYYDEDFEISRSDDVSTMIDRLQSILGCMDEGYTYSEETVDDIRSYLDDAYDYIARAYNLV